MRRSPRHPCERGCRARSADELRFAPTSSAPKRRRCEGRNANHHRMENEAERQIDYGADNDGDDVVLGTANRYWRRAGIFAALKRDAIVHRPGQYRSEQDDAAKV